jgi:hypothetical protein
MIPIMTQSAELKIQVASPKVKVICTPYPFDFMEDFK